MLLMVPKWAGGNLLTLCSVPSSPANLPLWKTASGPVPCLAIPTPWPWLYPFWSLLRCLMLWTQFLRTSLSSSCHLRRTLCSWAPSRSPCPSISSFYMLTPCPWFSTFAPLPGPSGLSFLRFPCQFFLPTKQWNTSPESTSRRMKSSPARRKTKKLRNSCIPTLFKNFTAL